ncbi:MAG: gluconate 2-dehydrogenase subunit 3 family protein [Bryobacteraceae bacterium]
MIGALSPALAPAIAAAQAHAHQAAKDPKGASLEFFNAADAAEIAAIASQILPSDDVPGAQEAGAIYFIDRALATFDAGQQDLYRRGLIELRKKRLELFPGSDTVAGLPAEQQVVLARAIEESEFFEAVRVHTLLGFLGDPSYGGNRGRVGWKHIGFEDRMAWQPPFGYYDGEPK